MDIIAVTSILNDESDIEMNENFKTRNNKM